MHFRGSSDRTDQCTLVLVTVVLLAASPGCGGFSNAEVLAARHAESAARAQAIIENHRAQAIDPAPCAADLERYREELSAVLESMRLTGSQLDSCFDARSHGASAPFADLARTLADELVRHASTACSRIDPESERLQHTSVMSQLLGTDEAAARRIAYMTGRLEMTPRCEEMALAEGQARAFAPLQIDDST